MKESKETKTPQQDSEFSLTAVPESERKSYISLTIIWTGFVFVIVSMMAGGTLAVGLSFKEVIYATLIGNVFLCLIAVAVSVIASKTGLTFALLTRYSFGVMGSKLASIFVPIVNIGWYFDRNGFMRGLLCLQKTFTDFHFDSLAANAPGAFAAVLGPAWGIVIISTILGFVHSVLKENGRDPYADVQRLPLVVRWALYYLVIFLTLISFICVTDTTGFLYANF